MFHKFDTSLICIAAVGNAELLLWLAAYRSKKHLGTCLRGHAGCIQQNIVIALIRPLLLCPEVEIVFPIPILFCIRYFASVSETFSVRIMRSTLFSVSDE